MNSDSVNQVVSAAEAAALPSALHEPLAKAHERLAGHEVFAHLKERDSLLSASLDRVLVTSEYAADILARYPLLLEQMLSQGRMHRSLELNELDEVFHAENPGEETEAQFMRRLRLFRHRELVRIIWRDSAGWSDCDETLRDLSTAADACIRAALDFAAAEMVRRHGTPRDAGGGEVHFVIVAMGKLGGGELNFSSDVDLVFLYSESGETDGKRALSNEEFFRRLAQLFIKLLSEKSADGFVYRVDARLRPFGDSGPLACSVDAFENYLVQHGRNWERYAWVKARVINPWPGTRAFYTGILRPFVYRRYLDFGVFSSLREMKSLIEQEGRAAENRENIKLGPGGIREIEFIVQTLQLVRGGTDRNLRLRSLLPALEQLGEDQLMSAETVDELQRAYRFLRAVENRLQMIADRQTHELPTDDIDRQRLTYAMGYADWDQLYAALDQHRRRVQSTFDDVLHHERDGEEERPTPIDALAALVSESFAADDARAVLERINGLRASPAYTRMDRFGQQRLDQLLPQLALACAANPKPVFALEGVLRVAEAIGRRSAYFALLNENQAALERLVRLCGSSEFLARQVAAHPLLLDELLDQRAFTAAPVRADFEKDLADRMAGAAPDDTEQRFEALRNFQQAAVFRVAVADLSGTLPLMRVSDRLTDIGELVLQEAIRMSWTELVRRHGKPMCSVDSREHAVGFAVAGYGKLGGLELGYGSDLDIVFMHDSAGEQQQTDGEKSLENAVFFGRLARRITHILTMPTPTGALYEVDTRLRPSGQSGLLVTSLSALDAYQKNDAWTWEHQALLRARAVAGSPDVCSAFEKLRLHVLLEYVDRATLADEVVKMRTRMRQELDKSDTDHFDIKQGVGGMIDLEFLVQYLVLLNAREHPDLLRWSDNIRQLESLDADRILSSAQADALVAVYQRYRERTHLLALAGEPGEVAANEFMAERKSVADLWQHHLGNAEQ